VKWLVRYHKGQEEVEAQDQWEAWDKVVGAHPERIGLAVSARQVGFPESESFPIAGVRLAFRYGYFEAAKQLDELAISQGLPSMWDQLTKAEQPKKTEQDDPALAEALGAPANYE